MNPETLAGEVLGVVKNEIAVALDRSDEENLEERLLDLKRQMLAFLVQADGGKSEAAERELRHLKATVDLVLAREAQGFRERINGLIEGALRLSLRVLMV